MMGQFSFGEWRFTLFTDFSQGFPLGRFDRQTGDHEWQIFPPSGVLRTQDHPRIEDSDCWRFSQEQLQSLMDGLWSFGIRPKDRRYEEEAKLKDSHLKDMRRLVFKDFPPVPLGD